VDGLERVAVEPVEPLASFLAHVHRSHFAEDPQVLGDLRLREAQQAHEVVHGALAAGEGVQDLAAPRLGHRVERIRCRRRSRHGEIIYRYRNIFRPAAAIG
jgi:hypothetical protein